MTCLGDKSARLLATGAVTITRRSDTRTDAEVRGDHGNYRVVGWPSGWACECPGHRYRRTCSHVQAVELVAPVTRRQGVAS